MFDSDEFGRFFKSADGSIVFSEKDEFIYDEMIVHVPMAVHPACKKCSGDRRRRRRRGQELGYYYESEKIDVVEPDRVLWKSARIFFPNNAWPLRG